MCDKYCDEYAAGRHGYVAGRHGYDAGSHGGLMPPIPRHNYSLLIMKYPPAILPPSGSKCLQCIVFESIPTPKLLIFNAPERF